MTGHKKTENRGILINDMRTLLQVELRKLPEGTELRYENFREMLAKGSFYPHDASLSKTVAGLVTTEHLVRLTEQRFATPGGDPNPKAETRIVKLERRVAELERIVKEMLLTKLPK